MEAKRTHLAAILAVLALVLATCGGDDKKQSNTTAAGTTTPAPAEQPATDAGGDSSGSDRPEPAKGDGGSSAADAQRASDASGDKPASSGGGNRNKGAGKEKKASKPSTPEEQLAALSPAKRRALHKDLYEQGKKACYAYGPKELAKSYNLTGADPETIAEQYARAYEAATPQLILPYQQGCLAGFRKFARNPPRNDSNN